MDVKPTKVLDQAGLLNNFIDSSSVGTGVFALRRAAAKCPQVAHHIRKIVPGQTVHNKLRSLFLKVVGFEENQMDPLSLYYKFYIRLQ